MLPLPATVFRAAVVHLIPSAASLSADARSLTGRLRVGGGSLSGRRMDRVQIPDSMNQAALFTASCDRVGVGTAARRSGA
jgi:hypothetical protein